MSREWYSVPHFYVVAEIENTEDLQPCRNRLATLADNIRAWEEDLSHPQIKLVSQDRIIIRFLTMHFYCTVLYYALIAELLVLIASSQIAVDVACLQHFKVT